MSRQSVLQFDVTLEGGDNCVCLTYIAAGVRDKRLLAVQEFRKALQTAVTNWVRRSEEGRTEWRALGGTISCQDLECLVGIPGLTEELEKQGIQDLYITALSSSASPWDSRTNLVLPDPELDKD